MKEVGVDYIVSIQVGSQEHLLRIPAQSLYIYQIKLKRIYDPSKLIW